MQSYRFQASPFLICKNSIIHFFRGCIRA